MSLHTEWIRYGKNSEQLGYLAKPERLPNGQPAVIVLQEIWGVDDHIQNVANRFAEAGYVALAPDLYAVDGKRKEGFEADAIDAVKKFLETVPPQVWNDSEARDRAMETLPEPQRTQVRRTFGALFGGLNLDAYNEQLLAASSFLRDTYPGSQGQPVVSIGFCMGGGLSARLATLDPKLAGAVIFYGQAPGEDRIASIQCPIRGFYASLDPRITDAVPAFAEQMQRAGKDFAYRVYEGAHHAFFNDSRASYHPQAARSAFAEVLTFFNQVTGGV
ncbi:carboxymethylenebutenolidase [Alicyclobacillus tengchongensis]|nr:carboxymethylenebutenolidase [Alicyclobacillus tengchongensis]